MLPQHHQTITITRLQLQAFAARDIARGFLGHLRSVYTERDRGLAAFAKE